MVNQVTSNVHDEESLCPEYKVTSIDFEKARTESPPVRKKVDKQSAPEPDHVVVAK